MRSKSGAPCSRIGANAAGTRNDGYAALGEIKICRGMVEVLVRIDQIFKSGTARELQSLFDLVDTPDIGINQYGWLPRGSLSP
jgi:hypothetical protein